MRTINQIIIHCSATSEGRNFTASDIARWHTQGRHWPHIGYHYVIRLDGTLENPLPIEQAGIHCSGHNAHSIGICYVGGLDSSGKPKDTRTPQQRATLHALIHQLRTRFPAATLHGHNEFANKACPCFDVSRSEFGTS